MNVLNQGKQKRSNKQSEGEEMNFRIIMESGLWKHLMSGRSQLIPTILNYQTLPTLKYEYATN